MKLKHILPLLLLLPALSACNQTDDVIDIFTGKTWKLTGIFYDKGSNDWCMDYWNNEEAWETSSKLLSKAGNFTITFHGVENGNRGEGEYQGNVTNSGIKGKWVANGDNNAFQITDQGNPNGYEDVLGKAFVYALIKADKYGGDVNNLRIYFEDKDKKDRRYLMFHVVNQ